MKIKRERLSIDVLPEEHRKIKAYAAIHGKTIREYVLESVQERLRYEKEESQLSAMTAQIGPALKGLWDNKKDASYDQI
ncbi:MAG: antitoxin [Deltaproteobacteria bacterium]|nr:antitoxin [Deltaproteobacteria bacterium]